MALKVSQGGMILSKLSPRTKAAALIFLVLMATVTISSKSGSSSARNTDVHALGSAMNHLANSSTMSDPLVAESTVTEKTAKIVTCPACRLNSLPLVKTFVHKHARHFEPQLKVDFIVGEDPVLYLYENGKEVSRTELEGYHWKGIIRKLFEFGIRPNVETPEIQEALREASAS